MLESGGVGGGGSLKGVGTRALTACVRQGVEASVV